MKQTDTLPKFNCMDEALRGTLQAIMRLGKVVSPRGAETREILNWSFRLLRPRSRTIHSESRRWSESLAIGELCWHLSGSDNLSFISYYSSKWALFSKDGRRIHGSCYGKRIFHAEKGLPSQWDNIVKILKQDPESRRAVLTLHNRNYDSNATTCDQPCLETVQFLLRKGQLHCIATMRSNDAIWGLCYDVFFVTMLQERLATQLGVRLGWYQHIANSMHVYKPFYKMARAIIAEKRRIPIKPMPIMRDVNRLPNFLAVEASLRKGDPKGVQLVQNLPVYWRELAQPLLKKYQVRRTSGEPSLHSPQSRMPSSD